MASSFVERVVAGLEGFPARDRYLVGVSGGRDSMALLAALLAAGYRRLIVCHLDHGLRGRVSRADARFVERVAGEWGLVFEGRTEDVRALAEGSGQSVEAAGRAARFAFFEAVARRRRCGTLLLGHHADDRVETLLFNLLRGAGTGGLRGMRRVTPMGRLTVVRPMLGVWRAEIGGWVEAAGVKFREDASNASGEATRNRLRHEVMPALEAAMGRRVRSAVWRAAEIAGAEDEWMSAQVGEVGAALRVRELAALPVALQRRTVHAWLGERASGGIGFDEVEAVRRLAEGGAIARVNLPGGLRARRRGGLIFLDRQTGGPA